MPSRASWWKARPSRRSCCGWRRRRKSGPEAYDLGALQLTNFFHQELEQFLESDLQPLGRQIIECCLAGGTVEDYARLLPHPVLETEE
jgi:hypothetical protein